MVHRGYSRPNRKITYVSVELLVVVEVTEVEGVVVELEVVVLLLDVVEDDVVLKNTPHISITT